MSWNSQMKHAQSNFVDIGAQRAGTTWLPSIFGHHPDIGMSPIKETQCWTSKHEDQQRNSLRGLKAVKIRMPLLVLHSRFRPRGAQRWMSAYLGILTHRDTSYLAFIELGRCGCPIAGEIAPAYATLPKEAFAVLDACLGQPRYCFILHNPAESLISQIAHTAEREASVLKTKASDLLAHPYFAMRSFYQNTCFTCWSFVDEDRLHILFHEDLFDPQKVQATFDALCAFFEVPSMAVDVDEVVNARPKLEDVAKREDIVARLQNDYRFACAHFPDALPSNRVSDLQRLDSLPQYGIPK